MSGEAIACISSSCRRLITGFGVPATDTTLYQLVTSPPLTPLSEKVATSGSNALRLAAAEARILSRPALISGIAAGADVIDDWICPDATSATAAPALL